MYEGGQQLWRATVEGANVSFRPWRVVRVTPKGAWITPQYIYREYEPEAEGKP
jgi:hypothetical protein